MLIILFLVKSDFIRNSIQIFDDFYFSFIYQDISDRRESYFVNIARPIISKYSLYYNKIMELFNRNTHSYPQF